MSALGDGDLNLPFEPNPPGQTMSLDDNATMSGGLVVLAACVPVPEVGPMPALIFRFATPAGKLYAPMVLVCSDEELFGLVRLVRTAAAAAVGEQRKQLGL